MMNDPPAAIMRMIEYLYTNDYDRDGHGTQNSIGLVAHAQVYAVAVTYLIPKLQDISADRITRAMAMKRWDVLNSFPRIVNIVYGSAPESDGSLHSHLHRFAIANLEALSEEEKFKEMMEEAPDFMRTIFQTMSSDAKMVQVNKLEDRYMPRRKYRCPFCSKRFAMMLPTAITLVCCPHCSVTRLNNFWLSFGS